MYMCTCIDTYSTHKRNTFHTDTILQLLISLKCSFSNVYIAVFQLIENNVNLLKKKTNLWIFYSVLLCRNKLTAEAERENVGSKLTRDYKTLYKRYDAPVHSVHI